MRINPNLGNSLFSLFDRQSAVSRNALFKTAVAPQTNNLRPEMQNALKAEGLVDGKVNILQK